MAERVTSKETLAWLEDYLSRRRDIGLWKAARNLALLPPNPLKPRARRQPRLQFQFAAGLFACASGWFFYFSFVQ